MVLLQHGICSLPRVHNLWHNNAYTTGQIALEISYQVTLLCKDCMKTLQKEVVLISVVLWGDDKSGLAQLGV